MPDTTTGLPLTPSARRKAEWAALPDTHFDALTFSDLKVGDRFILLLNPGDNRGGGGFRSPRHVFTKTSFFASPSELPHGTKVHGAAKVEGVNHEFNIKNTEAIIRIIS